MNKNIKPSIDKYLVLNNNEKSIIQENIDLLQFPLTLQNINNQLNKKFE